MGVSTGLTGRSKNLDPTQPASRPDPTGQSTRQVSIPKPPSVPFFNNYSHPPGQFFTRQNIKKKKLARGNAH